MVDDHARSGPIESFIPKPQSLAYTYCGKGLLSIVLDLNERWHKQLSFDFVKTAAQAVVLELRNDRNARLFMPYPHGMSNFGDDYSTRDVAYEGRNFFKVGDQKGMDHTTVHRAIASLSM